MASTVSYFVKSVGITLPDGSVFGAETREAFRVVKETGIHGFKVFEMIGTQMVNVFGSGNYVEWEDMKNAINERISYQISIGNKVLRGGEEITEV